MAEISILPPLPLSGVMVAGSWVSESDGSPDTSGHVPLPEDLEEDEEEIEEQILDRDIPG